MEEKMNEHIKIYPSNWLMAAGIVGFMKIFGNGNDYAKKNNLEIPEDFIRDHFPDIFSNFISRMNNPHGLIKTFYNNSPLAQIWQKSMRNTLIDLGVDKKLADEYVRYASNESKKNKQSTFSKEINLEDINSILRKVKEPPITHQKFLDNYTVCKVISIFKKYHYLSSEIAQLSRKRSVDKNKLPQSFYDLVKELEESGINDKTFLKDKIQKVINDLTTNYEDDKNLTCSFCNERPAIRREGSLVVLDEMHFTPLGASAKKVKNLYWEGKPNNFLCLPCELIVYCAAFGFTKFGNRYVFINAPAPIKEIFVINQIWKEFLTQERNRLSQESKRIFKDSLIEILKKNEKARARWTLQNIAFIELTPYSENTFNIYSFHITEQTALAVRKMIQSYPNSLGDIYGIFLDYIYSGKSLYEMVGHITYGYLNREKFEGISEDEHRKSTNGFLVLSGKKLKNPQDLLFFLKFQKEVESYGQ